MLRRAPTLVFCATMSAALGAGLPELVLVASLAVAIVSGGFAGAGALRAHRA